MRKTNETREYIDAYLKERERFNKEEQERMAEENRKILEYMEQQRKRQEDQEAKTAKKLFEKDRILEMVAPPFFSPTHPPTPTPPT